MWLVRRGCLSGIRSSADRWSPGRLAAPRSLVGSSRDASIPVDVSRCSWARSLGGRLWAGSSASWSRKMLPWATCRSQEYGLSGVWSRVHRQWPLMGRDILGRRGLGLDAA